jgi:hypothetical protein
MQQDGLWLVISVVGTSRFVPAIVEIVCFKLYQIFVLDSCDGIFVNAVEVPVQDVHLLEEVVPYTNRLTFCLCHLCYFCHGTLPCGMSLGQLPHSKENASESQSDGRNVYVSRMEFVSALLRKSRVFGLPCCHIPPCDMSRGHNSLGTDVVSVNQNYTHGAKEARTEMIPQPCSVATWTYNKLKRSYDCYVSGSTCA